MVHNEGKASEVSRERKPKRGTRQEEPKARGDIGLQAQPTVASKVTPRV